VSKNPETFLQRIGPREMKEERIPLELNVVSLVKKTYFCLSNLVSVTSMCILSWFSLIHPK
jgi:hypothetical protein